MININDNIFLKKEFIMIAAEDRDHIIPLAKCYICKTRKQEHRYNGVGANNKTFFYTYQIAFVYQTNYIYMNYHSEEKRDEVFSELFNNLP